MAEISAVSFSALPQAGDGYTVLYENNQVCRSEKKLSELVGEKTNSFLTKEQGDSLYQEKGNYLIDDDITGKLDKSQYAVDSATFLTAHQDISNKLDTTAFSTVSGDFLTEHQPISANEWNDVYETVVANSGTWETETDWTDDINEASANAYEQAVAQIPAPFDPTFLSGEIDKKLDKTFSSNFYPMTGNPSGFLTEHQDISNKLDETAFSTVSSNFLTAHQSLDDYATKDYVDREIGNIGSFEVVGLNDENVPDVNEPSTKIIYLTKEIDSEKSDPYKEWIYNDTTSAWECIGETTLDLVNYYQKNETSAAEEISAALASNSWKRISEQNGSKNTYSNIGNLSVYIGENNSANSPDSYTLGRNNNSEQGVNVGYYNIIDVNHQEPEPGNFNFGKFNAISGSPGGVNLGQNNYAYSWGINIGEKNTSYEGGYNFGSANSANNGSINIGEKNTSYEGGYNFGSANSANSGSINIGENNSATIASYNIGHDNKSNTAGYSFGYNNSTNKGFSIGSYNSTNEGGYAFGKNNTVTNGSFAIGAMNSTKSGAFTFGEENTATNGGLTFGKGSNSNDSIIFGRNCGAINGSIAIGYSMSTSNGSIAIGAINYAKDASFIIGNYNTANKGTTTIGDYNSATYTDIIGNKNVINKDILNNSGLSSEYYTKQRTKESIQIKNFVAGLSNSADYAKNAYILGNSNKIISNSADYINEDNDGYAFIYGWQNSANRNYDMAIGYKTIASGGENIAIGTPQTENSTKAIGYKNIAIRSDISGISNIAIDSYISNSYTGLPLNGHCGNLYRNTKLNLICTTGLQNNIFYNAVITNSNAISANNITNNLFFEVVNNNANGIVASNINHNRIKNTSEIVLSATKNISENDIVDCSHLKLSFNDSISHNTFNHNFDTLSISGTYCYNNTVTNTKGGAYINNYSNNFVYDTILVGNNNYNWVLDNFIFGSELHLQNSNNGIEPTGTGICHSILFGSTIYGNSYNSVSIAGDDNRPSYDYECSHVEDVNKTFNWGNNFIINVSETEVFGNHNTATNTDNCYIHGQGNSLHCSVQGGYYSQQYCMHHCEVNGSWNIISNISGTGDSVDYNKIIGDGNAIIVNIDTTNNKYYATRNTLIGDFNQLLSIPSANIDEVVNGGTSLQNISYNRATLVPSTLGAYASYSANEIDVLSSFATHDSERNTIIGSKNVISDKINDSIIFGHGNGIYNDLNYIVNTDIILGQYNLAVNGSNDFIAGDNIVASGHHTTAIGDTLISKASQIIIGKFNAPVDAAVRDGIAWNDTTSAVEPLTQSGVIFAIGNGTYNVTTAVTGKYSNGSPKTAYVDSSGNKLGDNPLMSEEYITRSNALTVSANGVVSAYDYYNAAGDKLSDLTEIISLLRNKPSTGTHVIKCIDGELTWVAET